MIEQTDVVVVLQRYGEHLPEQATAEYRMECVFNDDCADSQYGNLTVKLNDRANRIYCHSCGVRGNLLTLVHGLEKRQPPAGGRLRGDEFRFAVEKLREIANTDPTASLPATSPAAPKSNSRQENDSVPLSNVPLSKHEKEAARGLADLYSELIVDPQEMNPEAAQYVRQRPWMTPELLAKWSVGWIPGNGRSLFRKSYLVYTHRNERDEVVSYSGRDLSFEEKWSKWIRGNRKDDRKPNKHRFVSGFHRGAELYGGHASRIKEPQIESSLQKRGVVVVEGMNEVMRMDALGVAAVGLASNKATDTQVKTLTRFARTAGENRVLLLPDCDEEGEKGFQELLWRLNEQRVQTRVGVSRLMFDGEFAGRQPESFTDDEWRRIDESS